MWKCLNCGNINEGRFCGACGTPKPLENYQSNQQGNQQGINRSNQQSVRENAYVGSNYPQRSKPKKKKNTMIIVSTLLIIILIITGMVVFVMLNDKATETERDNEGSQQEISTGEKDEQKDKKKEDDKSKINEEKAEETVSDTEEKESDEEISEPEDEALEVPETDDIPSYAVYKNATYNFECAYPTDFVNVAPEGINAVKTLQSQDGTAVMIIRACENSDGISIDDAMKDYYNVYGDDVTYQANGDTWYVFARESGNKSYYRKCFIKNGNIYCMDFEFNREDMDIYSPYIEYIEDNFRTM